MVIRIVEHRAVAARVSEKAGASLVLVDDDPSAGQRLGKRAKRNHVSCSHGQKVHNLLFRALRVKRNNRLYVRVYAKDAGAMVSGEPLPALPNSILAVIESDRPSSGTSAITNAVVGSWDLPVDHVVAGMRTLTMTPTHPGGRP